VSDPKTNRNRDLSYFDDMSSERLQAYLDQDFLLPDEESDLEAVLYIMEVLARRENKEPSDREAVAKAAWAAFNKDYRDNRSNVPEIDFDAIDQIVRKQYGDTAQHSLKQKSTPRRKIIALRTVAVAAILIAALLFGSLASYASGFDLFGAIAKWTQETFGFSVIENQSIHAEKYPDQLSSFLDLLVDNKITESVLPLYLPADYEPAKTESFKYDGFIDCICLLTNGNSAIRFFYRAYSDEMGMINFEKDAGNPELYSHNSIDFYITTNTGVYQVNWIFENVECCISDVDSREELIKIINSIGG